MKPWLPQSGRALDVAGGASGDAGALAAHGLDVTIADVSGVALEMAQDAATAAGLTIATVQVDLEAEPLPDGPWDVITVANFLHRPLFPLLVDALADGGILAAVLPTALNLERNPRPGAPYLLEPGEVVGLVSGLQMLHHSEEWRPNNRHESWLVARQS